MSDTTNHKKAIDVLRVARKTPGLLLDVLLQVIADDPAKVVNAYDKVKPKPDKMPKCKECGGEVDFSGEEKCFRCWSKISSYLPKQS